MKILSNYKDYYDYLAYQYGVDDQIVFKRNRIMPLPAEIEYITLPECDSLNDDPVRPRNREYGYHIGSTNWNYYENDGKICQFESVSIAGTIYCYLYEYDKAKRKAIQRIPHKEDYENYVRWRKETGQRIGGHILWWDIWGGGRNIQFDPALLGIIPPEDNWRVHSFDLKLHQQFGVPILWKQLRNGDGSVGLVMPNLSKIIGFSGLYPAEKIYHDIYNFLQARRQTPDNDSPVAIDNQSKIVKHGFDLKKSFRHPVNSRHVRCRNKQLVAGEQKQ